MYLGPECDARRGEAPMNWITGTNGWMFRGIVENIIGIKAHFDGLQIDPTLPDKWDVVEVKRIFRGCTYNITIENKNLNGKYVISVDGKEIEGNILPLFDGGEHTVTVKRV